MNIKINTGAAIEDAEQIDSIVNAIRSSMETLDAAIKRNIPEGVQTDWSERVRSNWESYYNEDVPSAMEEMSLSASNLRQAVESSMAYSQEQ